MLCVAGPLLRFCSVSRPYFLSVCSPRFLYVHSFLFFFFVHCLFISTIFARWASLRGEKVAPMSTEAFTLIFEQRRRMKREDEMEETAVRGKKRWKSTNRTGTDTYTVSGRFFPFHKCKYRQYSRSIPWCMIGNCQDILHHSNVSFVDIWRDFLSTRHVNASRLENLHYITLIA